MCSQGHPFFPFTGPSFLCIDGRVGVSDKDRSVKADEGWATAGPWRPWSCLGGRGRPPALAMCHVTSAASSHLARCSQQRRRFPLDSLSPPLRGSRQRDQGIRGNVRVHRHTDVNPCSEKTPSSFSEPGGNALFAQAGLRKIGDVFGSGFWAAKNDRSKR